MHLILMISTLSLGLVFGAIFSVADVEKFWKNFWQLFYHANLIERQYLAPIGTMIGMTAGFMFMVVRCEELENMEKQYQREG